MICVDRIYPMRLDRAQMVSRVVTGEGGEWLYAQTSADEKWRFPAIRERIDPLYRRMLRLVEDQRFDYHPGIDPLAMVRALGQWIASGRIRSGGSTITMQLARLIEPKPRTLRSKIIEIIRAIQIEIHYTKAEILSAYLTLTPYGGNVEGIVAASWRYFGKRPENLSAAQAALLVALPRSPEQLRPNRHPEQSRNVRDRILEKAHKDGLISASIYRAALQEPLPERLHSFPRHAPHIAQRLLRQKAILEGSSLLTTLNQRLQSQLESWAQVAGAQLPKGATLALLVVRNRDAAVEAYLGSHDMFSDQTAGYVDMIRATRSPGSTLKPFVYAMAFEQHHVHPNTRIYDRQTRFGDYLPHNYSRTYTGEVTVRYALGHSLNIPAVKLLKRIGAPAFVVRLGKVAGKLHIPRKEATLPIILGGLGITPWQLAQLYTGLANGGKALRLHLRPSDRIGETARLCEAEAAKMVTAILRTVTPPKGKIDPRNRIAYKTGTSYGYRDLWTAAYTRDHTVIIWVGRPDNAPLPKQSGREVAAPLAYDALGIVASLLPDRMWEWDLAFLGVEAPTALRYFDREAKAQRTPMSFIRPTAHARFQSAGCHDVVVPCTVTAGKSPYTWYIDGTLISNEKGRWEASLGMGAHTITVIDRTGATVTQDVWVDQPECEVQITLQGSVPQAHKQGEGVRRDNPEVPSVPSPYWTL
jgi:penicillin-binding protein 1C